MTEIQRKDPPFHLLDHGRRISEGMAASRKALAEQLADPPPPPMSELPYHVQKRMAARVGLPTPPRPARPTKPPKPYDIRPQTPLSKILDHPGISPAVQEATARHAATATGPDLVKPWTLTTPDIGLMPPPPDPTYPGSPPHYVLPRPTIGYSGPYGSLARNRNQPPPLIPEHPVLVEAFLLTLQTGQRLHPLEVLPVRVCKTLRRHDMPMTVTEISERTRIPASSPYATNDKHPAAEYLHQALQLLTSRGYLLPCLISRRDKPGRYLTDGYVPTRRGRLLASRYTLI